MDEFIDDAGEEFIDDAPIAAPIKQEQLNPIQNVKGPARAGITPGWQNRVKPFKLSNGAETVQREDGFLWLDPSKGDATKRGWYKWENGNWTKGPDEPEKDRGLMGVHLSPLANLLTGVTGSKRIPNPTVANVVEGGKDIGYKLAQLMAGSQMPGAVQSTTGWQTGQRPIGVSQEQQAQMQAGANEVRSDVNQWIDRNKEQYREHYTPDIIGEGVIPAVATLPLGGGAAPTLLQRMGQGAVQGAVGRLISKPIEHANERDAAEALKSEAKDTFAAAAIGAAAVPATEYVLSPIAGAAKRYLSNKLADTKLGGMLGVTRQSPTIGPDVRNLQGAGATGDANALRVQELMRDYSEFTKGPHRKLYSEAWEEFGDKGMDITPHVQKVDELIGDLNKSDVPGVEDVIGKLQRYRDNLMRGTEKKTLEPGLAGYSMEEGVPILGTKAPIVTNEAPYRTFAELNKNRSDLGDLVSDAYTGGKLYGNQLSSNLQTLKTHLTGLMEEGAEKAGVPGAYSKLVEARQKYADWASVFSKNDIKALNKAQNVDDFVRILSKKGDSAQKNLKNALGPEGSEAFKAAYIQNLMERSEGDPLYLLKDVKTHKNLIENFFSGEDAIRLNGLMQLAKLSRRSAVVGGAGLGALTAHTIGGHGELWAALAGAGSNKFTDVPSKALFRLFQTPTGQNLLLQLGTEKAGTAGFAQAARNAIALAASEPDSVVRKKAVESFPSLGGHATGDMSWVDNLPGAHQ